MISDDGLIALMKVLPDTKLKVLNAAQNQVSSKGMVELTKALQVIKHDFTVDLSNNTLLGGAGISALVKADMKLDYLLFKVRRKLDDDKDDKEDEVTLGKPRELGLPRGPSLRNANSILSSGNVSMSLPGTPLATPSHVSARGGSKDFFPSRSVPTSAASSLNPTPNGSPSRGSLPSTPLPGKNGVQDGMPSLTLPSSSDGSETSAPTVITIDSASSSSAQ